MSPRIPIVVLIVAGCARPECYAPDYRRAECRVVAENQWAHLVDATGVEVRFQDPTTDRTAGWVAHGRVHVGSDGVLEARVATLGEFRLSIHPGDTAVDSITLRLSNVHPLIEIDGQVAVNGLTRTVVVPVGNSVTELRGTLPASACGDGAKLVAVGDIQTNPGHFQRIVEALHAEAALASADNTPLLGMLFLGDIAESGTRLELEEVARLMASAPVPTAVTPGNHDIYVGDEPVFNQVFGPGNMAFDVCDTHVVLLDTGSAAIADSIEGRLPELLASDRSQLIAGMHYPMYSAQTDNGWTRQDQADALLAEMAIAGVDLLVTGHMHRRSEHTGGPVHQIVVGTGGASQQLATPDYGYLRVQLGGPPTGCFVPVPAPGVAPDTGQSPANCDEL